MYKILVFFILSGFAMVAQVPQSMSYQGVARDAFGNIINTTIGLKFEILQGGPTGFLIYDETNTSLPSSAGIFTAAIGSGAAATGTFSTINWATGPYYIRVSIDPAGGTSYSPVGVTELLSVPYALYAKTSGNAGTTYSAGAGISISGGSIINTAMNQSVSISGAGTTTVSGTYPSYTITSSVGSATSVPASSLSINPPHVITNLGPNNNSITIQPTNITATTGIATIGGVYPNYNINIPPPVLTVNGGTIIITQGSASSTQTFSPSPWYKPTASTTGLVNANDFVGIGVATPLNRLHVLESTTSAAIMGVNSNATNAPNANGVQGNSQSTHSISAGVYGSHSSNGFGVYAINTNSSSVYGSGLYALTMGTTTNNVGVRGDAANGNAVGVMGISFGSGASVYGIKTNVGSTGPAGKFDNSNPANSSDAVFAITSGSGAAIRAVSGTGTISALSVHLDNGHIKSSSTAAPTQFSVTPVGGFSNPSTAPTCLGTDVKGVISFSTSVTGFLAINYFDVRYNFQKAYATAPTVLLTPTTDIKGLSFMVLSSSTTNFVVRIFRPNGATFPTTFTNTFFNFNYFIIE